MLFGAPPSLPPQVVEALLNPPAVVVAEIQRPRIVSGERGELSLEADRIQYSPETHEVRLFGNVTGRYLDPDTNHETLLTADEASLNHDTKEATFRSGVEIVDDIGTLTADEVYINYSATPVTGYARGIVLRAYEAYFEGEELIIEQGAYRLRNAWFSTCPDDYRVLLTDVVVRPGRFIHARRTGFELWGMRVPIPFFRVGLDPRETGLQAPLPSMDEDFRVGYRWLNIFRLGPNGSLLFEQIGGQGRVPYTNAQIAYDLLGIDDQLATVRNEDRERFINGFMDNINVPTPAVESRVVGSPKLALFAGHTANISTRARIGDPFRLDRAWYVGVEGSGGFRNLPMNAQIRYGSVRENPGEPTHTRTEGYATVMTPALMFGPTLGAWLRADVGAFFMGGSQYGWVRPHMNLGFKPTDELRFTASYFHASEWGTPVFDFDRLFSRRAMHFRFDLYFPATDVSFLAKYDFDRRDWYDFEFRLTQVMECVTPFISYRKFPGTFALGFTLRADRLFEALRRRELTREAPPEPDPPFFPGRQ